ncbi:cell growth-regulating nucleolar protein-like isoform X1 [Xenia sp. Carnegie-2017]|uniref:cell growth-regulating nucleolar protein-like isoform X1 n=1 Tax=Xenia sp. Carnegie-2017 TaxID=2897299 RepID=UPI001F04F99F|nr:cell growth-regulating nucleolar protein-like isoform X1 [Xenia sp. Carnegie-2017]
MVNFICDACGQTIKKQKVEKHYQTECRNCSVLSCIDCGQDFPGDSYVFHNSCITEEEKYQGKLYKPKNDGSKGERKQQEWLERLRKASYDEEDARVRKLVVKVLSYKNLPRKKMKFKKFCENSINIRNEDLLEKLWLKFSATNDEKYQQMVNPTTNKTSEENDTNCAQNENVNKPDGKRESATDQVENICKENPKNLENKIEINGSIANTAKCKKKKRKERADEAESHVQKRKRIRFNGDIEENDNKGKQKDMTKAKEHVEVKQKELKEPKNNGDKFKWEATIKKLLKSAPDNEMSVKKLRRKVIREFLKNTEDHQSRTEQDLRILFDKKLHKNTKINVFKEKAKYCK